MKKTDLKKPEVILYSILSFAIVALSFVAFPADADTTTTTVHAPCSDGTQTTAGLRSCSTFIPIVTKQVSNPVASYPAPVPSSIASASSSIAGLMQMYTGCYYKGIDLDLTLSTPDNYCQGSSFGLACELVPSALNHNQKELTAQASVNNPQASSCGTPMQASVAVATCADPTDNEAALLAALGTSATQLEGLSAEDAQALLAKAAAANTNVVGSASSGKKICITLDAKGNNGTLERAYLKGTFIQALSYYTDQVLNQLKCTHTISVAGTGCQKFANQVAGLTGTTQQNMSSLQSMLQTQQNLGDIDACSSQSFAVVPTTGGLDPGVLRQSAQHLCSARTSLEAAFSQLVMCDILSQTQISYTTNTGLPAVQLKLLNQMNKDLDPVCRPGCKSSKNLDSLRSCLQSCYNTQMPTYLATKFQAMWPQPTPAYAGSCVGGTSAQ